MISEQLSDDHEVTLLQVFEAREGFVEVLRQIEHFLGDFDDVWLGTPAHFNHLDHDRV